MKKRGLRRLLAAALAGVMVLTGSGFASTTTAFADDGRKIDVWDFGGVEETDTALYNNNVKAADWDAYENLKEGGTFAADGEIVFGDLTLNFKGNDRLFSGLAKKNYGDNGFAQTEYEDGYTANGMFYCNGTGGEKRRYVQLANVQAGDKIVVYMGAHNAADDMLIFQYLGEDAVQMDEQAYGQKTFTKHVFVAQYSGTYKIWTNAGAKAGYNRIVRFPGVAVSGTVDNGGFDVTGTTLSFVNNETNVETVVEVKDGKYTAVLAPGFEYTAVLSGVTGIGFTNDSKIVTVTEADVLKGMTDVKLVVEKKTIYDYTGKLTGFAADYDVSRLAVKLEAPADTTFNDVDLTISADLSFKASLEPDVEYTLVLNGVNDYEIVSAATVKDNQALNQDITVAAKAVYDVTGGFLGCEAKDVTAVKFVNVEDSYEYAGVVSANGYSAKLRNGSYSVVITSEKYTTSTHIVVNNKAVEKDIMAVPAAAEAVALERVEKLYVGYEDKAPNYATVGEAVAAAAAMNPASEEERITISIAPGTYREQVTIETPYITLVNESEEEVLLTWYYGIGYNYYSTDDVSGLYDAERAYDKYEKNNAEKWGYAVMVTKTATAFRAENIVFENSFNRYITDEEIEDGVEADTISFDRKYGVDVTSKAATERATALYVAADQAEFLNCSFLSSQDTLYTASDSYFKNCYIEGNTDFIFGSGDVVFDACEISLYGYSTGETQGYITAARTDSSTTATENGYLFRNCVVTADNLPVKAGYYFGRPWGADAKVRFENTKVVSLDLINAAGWTQMSGNQPEKANFAEYNTTDLLGAAADVSARVEGTIKTEAAAFDYAAYLGFTPVYAVAAEAAVAFATAPYVVDNGDINAPKPGHTLTAAYSLGAANDANDVSIIAWYRVKDGAETLVKISSAVVDDTYQITSEDTGAQIKVVVTPMNVNNAAGTAASYTVEEVVREGYDNPAASKAEAVLGTGINVYLAGDSTVKDYSAKGMYMNNTNNTEGSWGEYFAEFFNEELVTVVNYANGGRSTRNFINEDSLDKIKETIKEGDYLFIQFGHNDCSNGSGYLEDRYVPLGEPDANGVYPVTAGKEVSTPDSLQSKYGDTFYSYDCGGTYKWYLLQYINVAREAGAIPVLVTPVARQYFDADGNIKAAHDSTDATTGTQVTSGNAYVTAVKQLAEEENVLLIDATELTAVMYEEAYKADVAAANGASAVAKQAMCTGDSTHSSKLGGFISAAYMAQAVQAMDCSLAYAVQAPAQVIGENPNGTNEFSVSGSGRFTAYSANAEGLFTEDSAYWTVVGQTLVDEIALEAAKMSGSYTKSTMWVIGDSTVCAFNDSYFYPRYGYGTQLLEYFDAEKFEVQNLALSGRSSLSFLQEENYKTLVDGMQKGDVLVIGFGHNDEKAETARYTNPNGDYTVAGSFANNLYENYIKVAEEKGVTVILCTPIVRRTATGEWKDSELHITTTTGEFEGGNYAEAIIQLGKDTNTAVVDMTALTKEVYDSLGAEETLNLHAWLSSKPGSVDNTHTNIWGAKYNAYLFAKAVKALNISGISEHVTNVDAAPAKADNLVSNPDYVEPVYDSSALAQSELWADYGIFKGTVFGDVGGTPNTTNQTLETDANGNMHIAVANNKGKISGSTDGIAMYYYKIPADASFTLSADMTINAYSSNNQVAFGLMVRDAMYIDFNSKDFNGDSVNAAFSRLADMDAGVALNNSYARKDGKLMYGPSLSRAYTAGETVTLTLSGTPDGYATTIGNEETVSGGFDFKLTSFDEDYVYIGMFAARNADVTFSNIKLTVNGQEIDVMDAASQPSFPAPETGKEKEEPAQEVPAITESQYTVAAGNTLGAIAKAAGVTVKELVAANDIENADVISIGLVVNIPEVKKEGRYIVKAGDTLKSIAEANGCTVADLVALNGIENPDVIVEGEVLYVK
ncbi:MAG: LysM peptidoglycan-binding domain-containing protein [Lachnospiraceae bacterium]|nr:LysM peptidoglycan-binding domain-containing protein [Lachnospiraceae bacterium]